MWYVMSMNDTNEVGWLARLIIGIGIVGMLAILVGCMVAPLFGKWIEGRLYQSYYMDHDCEQKVANMMPSVWLSLWIIAFLAWAFVLAINLC